MSEARVLKRYKNRRLYDPLTKTQVTLAHIRELVNAGENFRIEDNATGKDVTVSVLVQVFGEDARRWSNWDDTTSLLRLLIQKGGDTGMTILSKTVLAAIGALAITKENAEKWIDELIKRGELDKGKRAEALREAADKAEAFTRDAVQKIGDKVSSTIQDIKDKDLGKRFTNSAEMKELRKTVDDLSAKLEEMRDKLN